MIRTLGMIYRKDKPLSRAALGFIDEVVEFAQRAGSSAQKERPANKEKVLLSPRKASKAS